MTRELSGSQILKNDGLRPNRKYPYHVTSKELKRSYKLRLEAQFGDERAKRRLQAYNKASKERRMELEEEVFYLGGQKLSRGQMQEYIVSSVSNGESLPQVCEGEGCPSVQKVYSWFENYPAFKNDYIKAEEVRGHRLGEKALDIALATNRETVNADKLKVETLRAFAARANSRFTDKIIQVQEDEYRNLSEDQIREKVRRMIAGNPSLVEALQPEVLEAHRASLEIVLQPESSSLPTLAHGETDTPEGDET